MILRLVLLRPNIRFFPPPPPTIYLKPDPTRRAKARARTPAVRCCGFFLLRFTDDVSPSYARRATSSIDVPVQFLESRPRPLPPAWRTPPSSKSTCLACLRAPADRAALFHLSCLWLAFRLHLLYRLSRCLALDYRPPNNDIGAFIHDLAVTLRTP